MKGDTLMTLAVNIVTVLFLVAITCGFEIHCRRERIFKKRAKERAQAIEAAKSENRKAFFK